MQITIRSRIFIFSCVALSIVAGCKKKPSEITRNFHYRLIHTTAYLDSMPVVVHGDTSYSDETITIFGLGSPTVTFDDFSLNRYLATDSIVRYDGRDIYHTTRTLTYYPLKDSITIDVPSSRIYDSDHGTIEEGYHGLYWTY